MLTILILSFTFAIIISAFCSLMESALYAVPVAYVDNLAKAGNTAGKYLKEFKDDMGKPVSGILILNTISNTAGASVTGWAAGEVFGSSGGNAIIVLSIVFTLCILYISEIIPKLIGVVYSKQIAPIIAYPLRYILIIEAPMVYLSNGVSRFIKGSNDTPVFSSSEIMSMATLGEEEGSLDELEGSIIRNIIGLDRVLVKDVLTPRVVVFRLEENIKIKNIKEDIFTWNHTRVPIFSEENQDVLTGYVTQRDMFRALIGENDEKTLKDYCRSIETVPELMRVDKLLLQFFEKREHICAVVDEHGGLAGIITLEDILEEIIGREIMDEYDAIKDLRRYAKFATKRKYLIKTDS